MAKLEEELVERGYSRELVAASLLRVRQLRREDTLAKVPRTPSSRVVLTVPFDRRLPSITALARHRHKCLLERDQDARDYLAEPPMVGYLRPKNLREWLVRAVVPAPPRPRALRPPPVGFRPCGRRNNCSLCLHSPGPTTSYTCPFSNTTVAITQRITCSDVGIYILLCRKDSGPCRHLHPTYIGECGDGASSSFTHRVARHLATSTNPSQADTEVPVGRHMRLPGHRPDSDLVMLPIEKISDPFRRKAREAFYIRQFATLKRLPVTDIEHGLNMSPGQTF